MKRLATIITLALSLSACGQPGAYHAGYCINHLDAMLTLCVAHLSKEGLTPHDRQSNVELCQYYSNAYEAAAAKANKYYMSLANFYSSRDYASTPFPTNVVHAIISCRAIGVEISTDM